MKSKFFTKVTAVLAVLSASIWGCVVLAGGSDARPVGAPTPAPEGEEWVNLFLGDHAAQWENVTDRTDGLFEIEDGAFRIFGASPTRYIAYTGDTFGDFDLHIQFKLAPGTNSGLFFRTDPKNPVYGGMEIQVLDDHGSLPNTHTSGGLYDVATAMFNMSLPAGEWNSYDMTCRGGEVVVYMNGWKVLDIDLDKMTMPIGKFPTPLAELPKEGHIILQDHGGEVVFRNLLVRKH